MGGATPVGEAGAPLPSSTRTSFVVAAVLGAAMLGGLVVQMRSSSEAIAPAFGVVTPPSAGEPGAAERSEPIPVPDDAPSARATAAPAPAPRRKAPAAAVSASASARAHCIYVDPSTGQQKVDYECLRRR
jgi:hypothetical protein